MMLIIIKYHYDYYKKSFLNNDYYKLIKISNKGNLFFFYIRKSVSKRTYILISYYLLLLRIANILTLGFFHSDILFLKGLV
jgi:hypothetical protein